MDIVHEKNSFLSIGALSASLSCRLRRRKCDRSSYPRRQAASEPTVASELRQAPIGPSTGIYAAATLNLAAALPPATSAS
jgi:hypothetical protein